MKGTAGNEIKQDLRQFGLPALLIPFSY